MYDVDGNGWIDISEMTRIIKSIYNMMGPQTESAERRAREIFRRMDRGLERPIWLVLKCALLSEMQTAK